MRLMTSNSSMENENKQLEVTESTLLSVFLQGIEYMVLVLMLATSSVLLFWGLFGMWQAGAALLVLSAIHGLSKVKVEDAK